MTAGLVPADATVARRVVGHRHAPGAERLDALVVAVGALPAVVDHGEAAVRMTEHDHRGVDVAGGADRLVDPDVATGENLDHLTAGDEPGHVEVVDRHVEEQPAGAFDVGDRRRGRVAARDPHHVQPPELPGRDCVAYGPVSRVEAPVEPDMEHHPGGLHGGEGDVDLGEVERDRLFAEDRHPGARRRRDQFDVGVGARADGDGIDPERENLVDRIDRGDGQFAG